MTARPGARDVSGFEAVRAAWRWDEVTRRIEATRPADVDRAIARSGRRSPDDFLALVSPAAAAFLEPMAVEAAAQTRRRFGHAMQLYAPIYLSNECNNVCTYCGFSREIPIARTTLDGEAIEIEADALAALGFDHVLVVTGEAPERVDVPYLARAIDRLRPRFSQIGVEVQPLDEDGYAALLDHGLSSVTVYQETYHRETYREHHPKGPKASFDYRLGTPERASRAGVSRIGLGCLLGLEAFRTDAAFVALHLDWLERACWRSRYSISFPRLRPHAGERPPKVEVSDRDLLQLVLAFRIFDPEVELVLSTRESPRFRDHVCTLGITTMSAGSRTNPGGYSGGQRASLEQFSIHDERTPAQVAAMLDRRGLQPVFKDWDAAYDRDAARIAST